jgi:putative tryptophan/tyrosine transport system substrate-binding protein
MNQKVVYLALSTMLFALCFPATAQQPKKVPRIGVMWLYSPDIASPFAEAFRQGLRGLGYVEGQNIALEERWAEGRFDRLPSLAAELVRLKVEIIVTASTPAAQAGQQATRSIPSS